MGDQHTTLNPEGRKQFVGADLSVIAADNVPASHPVARFNDYWLRKSGGNRSLEKVAISPMAIPDIMPFMVVFDVVDIADAQFRYRLMGSAIVTMIGKDATGQMFGYDLPDNVRRVQAELMISAINAERPLIFNANVAPPGRTPRPAYLGSYPLLTAADTIEQLIIVIAPAAL